MPRLIIAQLHRRSGRAVAMLLGVLVATTGFTVLTGSTATSRLRVTETVDANLQAAYDILVRPAGSRSRLEEDRGLVRPNFLSGQFGGITMAQYEQVRRVTGVTVAAPIAMVGHAKSYASVDIDLTGLVDRSAERQLFRLTPTWLADRGLTVLDDAPQYVYVTRRPLIPIDPTSPPGQTRYADGTSRPDDRSCNGLVLEEREDGSKKPLCFLDQTVLADGLSEAERVRLHVRRMRPDGRFEMSELPGAQATDRLVVTVVWPVLVLVAAIDPQPEAALVGLDRAVVSGNYLRADDTPVLRESSSDLPGTDWFSVPVLLANRPYVDERVSIGIERLGSAGAERVAGVPLGQLPGLLGGRPGVEAGTVENRPGPLLETRQFTGLDLLIQPGDPVYDTGTDALRPRVVAADRSAWSSRGLAANVPIFAADNGFRTLTQVPVPSADGRRTDADAVGVFDPQRLTSFSGLSRVPLETYQPPAAAGADQRSRDLLGGQPLAPNSNPAGYLGMPPLMLTTLNSLPHLLRASPAAAAPLSAIRVRVAAVHGVDAVSRERVRRVAEDIAVGTGLDVDITVGSSPAPQIVDLPAGNFGRPALRLSEDWTKKGVAVAIAQAVDRKSIVLFGLVLAVCVLFLANAVAAAVRDRRGDLAVLSCLGWSRWRLAGLVTGEVALVGALAGVLAASSAPLLGRVIGISVPARQAWLAVPVALALALVASAVPAWRAARTHPAATTGPAVRAPGRAARRRRTLVGLAVANLWRMPGRTTLGVAALAVGTAAVTMLAAVTWVFHGTVTGTLLGDAVSLRVRGVDVVAVATTVLLAVAAVADVLYLNLRDRAAELAALRATGWSDVALGRLVAYEGLGIGVLGAMTGAVIGLAGAAWFAGDLPPALLRAAGGVAVAGVLLAGIGALVPALLQRRLPISTLLAEE